MIPSPSPNSQLTAQPAGRLPNASQVDDKGPRPWSGWHGAWCGHRCSRCSFPRSGAGARSRRCDTRRRAGTCPGHDSIVRIDTRDRRRTIILEFARQHPRAGCSQPRLCRRQVQAKGRPSQRDRARSHRRGATEDTRPEKCRRGTATSPAQPGPRSGSWPRPGRAPAREPARSLGSRALVGGHEL